jgi:hypothetical protein
MYQTQMQIKMCVDNTLGSRGNNYKTGHVIFFYVPVECPLYLRNRQRLLKVTFIIFLHKIRSTLKINTEWIISTNLTKRS